MFGFDISNYGYHHGLCNHFISDTDPKDNKYGSESGDLDPKGRGQYLDLSLTLSRTIPLYTHPVINFLYKNISFKGLGLKRVSKFEISKKFKTKF